jgi:hypothetical protein
VKFGSKGEEVPGNGLASAILRVGRRVLIDVDAFDVWLKAHRCASKQSSGPSLTISSD